jgi:hypothetical protein
MRLNRTFNKRPILLNSMLLSNLPHSNLTHLFSTSRKHLIHKLIRSLSSTRPRQVIRNPIPNLKKGRAKTKRKNIKASEAAPQTGEM